MPRTRPDRHDPFRLALAAEAARMIAEQGIESPRAARHRLAQRHRLGAETLLPSEREIEEALRAHQRLFRASGQALALAQLRRVALEAMQALAAFEPRLLGAVLEGSADEGATIGLHLFCDEPEEVLRFLVEHAVPYRDGNARLWFGDRQRQFPRFAFAAEGCSLELVVLPRDLQRESPRQAPAAAPLRRASAAELSRLMTADDAIPAD